MAKNNISPQFEELGFNTGAVDTETEKPIGDGNPAVKDPKFRHALGYAVDRDRIVKSAFQGRAIAGTTVVPATYDIWHWDPPKDEAFYFDIKKAGELLDAAGYKKGADGKRTLPNGKPIGTLAPLRAQHRPVLREHHGLLQGVAGRPRASTPRSRPWTTTRCTTRMLAGKYDIFQWDWYVEPDPDAILADFTCAQRGGLIDSWYCDKAYDAMYKAQNAEIDHAKRVEIVKKMQQKLYEDAPYIVIAEPGEGQAIRTDRFACLQPQPDPGGVWLIQYGGHNYTEVRPAAQAGDCDGVTSAVGAEQLLATPRTREATPQPAGSSAGSSWCSSSVGAC